MIALVYVLAAGLVLWIVVGLLDALNPRPIPVAYWLASAVIAVISVPQTIRVAVAAASAAVRFAVARVEWPRVRDVSAASWGEREPLPVMGRHRAGGAR